MEGVSSILFSVREEGSPAVSPSRFRQSCEFPTGAAFLKYTVRNDVPCTLRSMSVWLQLGIRVVPRIISFVPFQETGLFLCTDLCRGESVLAQCTGCMAAKNNNVIKEGV